jgi:hypothetical protein
LKTTPLTFASAQTAGAPSWHRSPVFRAALILAASTILCLWVYLALAVPGAWFPSSSRRAWGANEIILSSGIGKVVDGELVITAPDADGLTLVTVGADLKSTGFATIAWLADDVPDNADVRLLWRSSYTPEKTSIAPVRVQSGRTLPAVVAENPGWIGHVIGLALAIKGPLQQPLRIRGVIAKPAGAMETLRDRAAEWFAFERWSGTSINTLSGGADVQPLPLPVLLACVVALASGLAAAVTRRRPAAFIVPAATVIGAFFLIAWLALDVRWTWNLLRQGNVTAGQYAGRDTRAKHLAAEDGPLYAFIEKSLQAMPASHVRVFVAADEEYYRERAAYHLYPHSAYFQPGSSRPPTAALHSGDWILVYRSHGVQYDASDRMLRWEGGQAVSADLKVAEPGAALFLIR